MAGVSIFYSGSLPWDPCLGHLQMTGNGIGTFSTNDNLSIDIAKALHIWHGLQKQSQEWNSCDIEGKHVEKH